MKNPKLEAIAAALGATFIDRQEMSDRGIITMPDGLEIYAVEGAGHNGADKGKFNFSPSWPRHVTRKDGSKQATSQRDFMPHTTPYFDGINSSTSKTPEQVAADIRRRFLPVVAPMWTACLEYVSQKERDYTGMAKMEALGRELFKWDSAPNVRTSVEYAGTNYLNIQVNDLNEEQARKLAAFLQTL